MSPNAAGIALALVLASVLFFAGLVAGPIRSAPFHPAEPSRAAGVHSLRVPDRPASSAPGRALGAGPSGTGAPNWSQLANFPENLTDFSMTYDAADHYVLLFGGVDPTGRTVNDTWIIANGTWTDLTPTLSVAPSPPNGMELAYDSADGYVLGYGGNLTYTWEFLHGRWSPLAVNCSELGLGSVKCTSLPSPMAGDHGENTLVNDAAASDVLLYSCGVCGVGIGGGQDYRYHAGTWTYLDYNASNNRTYYPPTIGSVAYDAADGYIVGFGGGAEAPYYMGGGWGNVTYRWNGATWVNLTGGLSVAPGPRFGTALAADPSGGGVLLYGGWDFVCTTFGGASCSSGTTYYLGDTWEFVNGSWSLLNASGAPGDRFGAAVSDPADGGVLLVGQSTCAARCSGNPTVDNATWLWSATPPLSAFSASATPSTAETGQAVAFSAAFRGGTPPIAVAWDFGDGTGASVATTGHAYAIAGTYATRVWVNDSAGHSVSAGVTVLVVAHLAIAPSASPGSVDAGVVALFSPGSVGGVAPVAYAWTFGDGTASALAAPTHAYGGPGTYHVWLNATDANGIRATASFPITVAPPVAITSLTATPSQADLGRPVNFSATAAGGIAPYTFAWSFGDGGVGGNLANITHIFTTNGPFVVTVTVADQGAGVVFDSINLTITLNASLFASGAIGAAPLPLSFTGNATGGLPGYSYFWDFGDGSQSTAANPAHTFASPGNYNVSLTVHDRAGHAATASRAIEVFPGGGTLALGLAASASQLAVGGTTTITADPHGGSGRYTLAWTNVPSGCRATGPITLDCTATASGSYAVGASLSDATGAVATASTEFVVAGPNISPPPSAPWPAWLPWAVGAAVVVVAAVGLYALRQRRPPALSSPPPSDRYAAYRSPATPPTTPEPTGDAGSLDDVF